MEKFITNLEANANYKNIKKGFKWENIPKFAVITGENGSGKTALLRQIYNIKVNQNANMLKIFNYDTIAEIKYINNIALQNKQYNFTNDYRNALKRIYETSINIENPNNEFKKCINALNNKELTFKSFINRDYLQNPDFTEGERNIIDGWRNNLNFIKFQNFFKRHNITGEQLLIEMTPDEVEKWLDSINDINIESKPTIFDEQLLINNFVNYSIKFENCKLELEKENKDKTVEYIYKKTKEKVGENPLDRINEILQKYYSKYELETKRYISNLVKVECRDIQSNTLVPLNELSLGEQIIVSLIMWQYEYTNLGSLILLLDEPDAHLNPKMAKMLIDILKNVVVKEFDCQVIMTTHSLSSVAYCEDNDLFFMEDGNIRRIDKKEAIEKLSDGIMTFDNAMNKIEQIQNSNKQILMVEGIFDKLHIENFYKLSNIEMPFEIIECGGADNMSHFAIAFTQLKIPKENILFLCDYDKVGYKINNKIIKQGYNAIYTLDIEHLNQDDDKIRLKNYPIEMLYPFNILKENNLLEELALKEFIDNLDKEKQKEKSDYFSTNISVNNKEKYKLVDNDSIKSNFAREIIDKLDIENDFNEIKKLIDRIEKILIKNK